MEIEQTSDVAEKMKISCERFLDTLGSDQLERVLFDFRDSERQRWHYVPGEMFERKGLSLKDMNDKQRDAAFALLAMGLSRTGYEKARLIMEHESILGALEKSLGQSRLVRDPTLYFFNIFGEPSYKNPWGWRAEGHHLSLHFTIVNRESLSPYPLFMGANPAKVFHGPEKGLRILSQEEDLGRTLLKNLNADQKAKALISPEAPADIVTRAEPRVELGNALGLVAESMNADQRKQLVDLIHVYLKRLPDAVSRPELNLLKTSQINEIHFAWAGFEEPGKPHYYRLHSPTFLTEYDNTQNNANHIHTVWRHLHNDFGRDLLKLHYENGHH